MTKIVIENNIKLTGWDLSLIKAIQDDLLMHKDISIQEAWNNVFTKCTFQRHTLGKSGNHIWINRDSDNRRIGMILDI